MSETSEGVRHWRENHCSTCGMHVPQLDGLRAAEERNERLYERVKALETAAEGLIEAAGAPPNQAVWGEAVARWCKATGEQVAA